MARRNIYFNDDNEVLLQQAIGISGSNMSNTVIQALELYVKINGNVKRAVNREIKKGVEEAVKKIAPEELDRIALERNLVKTYVVKSH